MKCANCNGDGGFKVDSWILYGIPGGEDWGEMCEWCKGSGEMRLLPRPKPDTWQILDRSDANGPWYLVRDRNDAGYSPIHVMGPDALSDALRILWRRSVA